MKTIVKNLLIVFIILLVISGIFTLYSSPFEAKETIPLNQVVSYINNDEVVKITVQENKLEIELKDGTKKTSQKEKEVGLTESLKNYGVDSEKLKAITLELNVLAWCSFALSNSFCLNRSTSLAYVSSSPKRSNSSHVLWQIKS